MAQGKIKAICDIDFLESRHCDFLNEAQKCEILGDYAEKKSLVVGFVLDDLELFVAVYNLTPHSLHVEHVVGNFSRYVEALDSFSKALAAMCGYNRVTFCTERRAIANHHAPRAGYTHEIDFQFVKKV